MDSRNVSQKKKKKMDSRNVEFAVRLYIHSCPVIKSNLIKLYITHKNAKQIKLFIKNAQKMPRSHFANFFFLARAKITNYKQPWLLRPLAYESEYKSRTKGFN